MKRLQNISDLIDPKRDPNTIAIVDRTGGTRNEITYGELLERIAIARTNLTSQHGVEAGDYVVLLGANSIHYLAAYFASMSIGAVATPINPSFEPDIIKKLLDDVSPKIILADEAFGESTSAEYVPIESIDVGTKDESIALIVDPEALAVVLFTSGSTGAPKGVMLSHSALIKSLYAMEKEIALLGQTCVIVSAPLFHMGALNYVHMWFTAGGKIALLPRFEAGTFLTALEEDRVAVIGGVPPMIPRLAKAAQDLGKGPFPGVGAVAIGSAPLTEAIIEDCRNLFPNAMVVNNYGTTEIGPGVFGGHPEGLARPQMSIGYTRNTDGVRLADGANDDEGVLEVKAESLMKGYLHKDDLTQRRIRNGWYRTGDLMQRDENGFFFCVGREDDMFLCNGENVYPIECEALLESHPDILQAAVIPVEDAKSGSVPIAFVVLANGADTTEDAIRQFTRENGPAYRHPRRVIFLDTMPMNAVNKIDKATLSKHASISH